MKRVLYILTILFITSLFAKDSLMQIKQLTPEAERVVIHEGTEWPFSDKNNDHEEDGIYKCKQCGSELFLSKSKFDSKSGWPSFDEAIDGAIEEIPDSDGLRTEIVCATCKAHLGHVFRGEGFTSKNTRHCVNSISLDFTKE
ncbi:MAG: methionine-R-sulfoxide reductase [Arcobacter butzleri]|nr:methionine-R-sulfoxide reductase [Aliarcobacter butzleri]